MKLLLIIIVLLMTSCKPADVDAKESKASSDTVMSEAETKTTSDSENNEDKSKADNQTIESTPEAQKLIPMVDTNLKPNELGQIMVLMYHNIGEAEEEWVRTPENFRKDLRHLYDNGYVPISLKDYVSGNIHTPAGKTPYILTFDDTRENNFRYLEDGSIDPDCAVGILLEFAKEYPDIKPYCTFFSNADVPFRVKGQEKQKVNFLIENYMDLGNHTVTHPDLTEMNTEDVNYEIGHQAKYLSSLFDNGYEINTIALPFGSRPNNPEAENMIFNGTYEGFEYKNIAVLNVGWDPYFSPYHKDFNPHEIHRVRASETEVDGVGLYDWLKYFEENPEHRFISDGYPDVITVKSKDLENIKETDKELFIY